MEFSQLSESQFSYVELHNQMLSCDWKSILYENNLWATEQQNMFESSGRFPVNWLCINIFLWNYCFWQEWFFDSQNFPPWSHLAPISCLLSANRKQSSDERYGGIGCGGRSDSEDPSVHSDDAECPCRSNNCKNSGCESRIKQSTCQSGSSSYDGTHSMQLWYYV